MLLAVNVDFCYHHVATPAHVTWVRVHDFIQAVMDEADVCCYAHMTYTLIRGEKNACHFLSSNKGQYNLENSITNSLTVTELSPYSTFNSKQTITYT
jgi:hypothetical protein